MKTLGLPTLFACFGLFVACSGALESELDPGSNGQIPGDDGPGPSGTGGAVGTDGGISSGGTPTGVGGTTGDASTGTGGSVSGDAGLGGCEAGELLDDLETEANWGEWRPYHDESGGTLTPYPTFAAEMSESSGYAVHLAGTGFSTWGAGIARTFDTGAACVPESSGIRFRAKGPGTLTLAASVTGVLPAEEGGTCTADCYNAHETRVTLTDQWADYEVPWTRLQQPEWGPRVTFAVGDVKELLFAVRTEDMTAGAFDFWIDDLTVYKKPTGTVGDGGVGGDCVLDTVLPNGKATFEAIYSARRNPFYTYEGLCEALKTFPDFANSGDLEVDRREVAAFFGNVSRETGELDYIEQIVKEGDYYGRGPLQLTHDYNYKDAGSYLGVDLLNNPGLLATDPVLTWEASLWFWMIRDAGIGTCHGAITGGEGFGKTIRIINGGLECDGKNPEAVGQRVGYYTDYCGEFGVEPGAGVEC